MPKRKKINSKLGRYTERLGAAEAGGTSRDGKLGNAGAVGGAGGATGGVCDVFVFKRICCNRLWALRKARKDRFLLERCTKSLIPIMR
jgi:hypothetical protein